MITLFCASVITQMIRYYSVNRGESVEKNGLFCNNMVTFLVEVLIKKHCWKSNESVYGDGGSIG